MKKIISVLSLIVLLLINITPAFAVNNQDLALEYSLKQTKSMCVVNSVAMMFRRQAIIDKNDNWKAIDERAIRNYKGNMDGIIIQNKVAYKNSTLGLDMTANATCLYSMKNNGMKRNTNPRDIIDKLKEYLNKHPEGITLYVYKNNTDFTHAVLLTHYVGDEFYCIDPANSVPKGIINLKDSILTDSVRANSKDLNVLFSYAVKIWYVSDNSNTSTAPKQNTDYNSSDTNQNDSKTDGSNEKKHQWWHISYDSKGYCKNCGTEYDIDVKSMSATTYQIVKNDVPVRNRPYSADKIIKYLSKGTKVTVIGSGKNSAGNLWYKLSDGTWIYSGNLEKYTEATTSCKHSYNDSGYCSKCKKEYPISLTSMNATYETTKNDVPVRNRPYSPDKIIKYLSKGTKVTVVGSGKNSVGNLWYKLKDGTWIYGGNLKKHEVGSTLNINITQYPSSIEKGKSFGLRGSITSNYKITSVKGYILDSNGNTVQSTSDTPNTKSIDVRYANLNEKLLFNKLSAGKYTLKVVAKDDSEKSRTWSKEFTVKSTEKTSCSHSYDKSGYCSKCKKEYPISLTSMSGTYVTTKNDVPVRNRPYSPDKIIKYLSKGTKVTVVGSGKNSVGNLWYKLKDGTWIYSGNLTKSSDKTNSSSVKISLTSYPKGNLKYGKKFTLSGKFTSDCAIVEARAYILDSNKKIVMEAKGSSTTSNYYIEGYALDKGMKFDKLNPGGYYLKYYVKDANGDTATWLSDMFYIVK